MDLNEEPISPVNAYSTRAVCIKGRWTATMYLAKKFTDYKKYAALEAKKQYKDEPVTCSVKAVATFRFGTRRKKDLPNAGKLEYDAFNGIIYEDDTQITKLQTEKIYDKENPGVTFEFYIAEPSVWGED